MVTFVKSGRIRSSMSRKDNVHPQQPHKPIIATLILPSRAADSAGSGGVAGISCDAISSVTMRRIRLMRSECPFTDGFDFVLAPADRHVVADPLFDDGADGADLDGIADLLVRHRVGAFGIDFDPGLGAAVADAEDLLAGGFVADEFHAALAEDAAIPLQPDFFRGVVPLSMREPVREAGDQHVHLVADRLQRAAAALLATRAVVVAFGEQQFHQRLSDIGGFRFVDLDFACRPRPEPCTPRPRRRSP